MVQRWLDRAAALAPKARRLLAAGLEWLRRAKASNPRLRERGAAISAFAAIALFAGLSLDYLLTGGPQWNPSAQAAPLAIKADYIILAPLPELPYAAPTGFAKFAPAPELLPAARGLTLGETLLGGPEAAVDFQPKPAAPHKPKS